MGGAFRAQAPLDASPYSRSRSSSLLTFQVDEERPSQLGGVRRHGRRVLGEERGLGSHHELVQLGGAGCLLRLQHLAVSTGESLSSVSRKPRSDTACS